MPAVGILLDDVWLVNLLDEALLLCEHSFLYLVSS